MLNSRTDSCIPRFFYLTYGRYGRRTCVHGFPRHLRSRYFQQCGPFGRSQGIFSLFPEFKCHDCPVQPCSYDQIVIFFHVLPLFCGTDIIHTAFPVLYSFIYHNIFPRLFYSAPHFSLICLEIIFFHLQISNYALNVINSGLPSLQTAWGQTYLVRFFCCQHEINRTEVTHI